MCKTCFTYLLQLIVKNLIYFSKFHYQNTVRISGSRKIAPGKDAPGKILPGKVSPGNLLSRKNVPQENCHPENWPPPKKRILWSFFMIWNILKVNFSTIFIFLSLKFRGLQYSTVRKVRNKKVLLLPSM